MIGLDDGWDEDLYLEDKFVKTSELLQRALARSTNVEVGGRSSLHGLLVEGPLHYSEGGEPEMYAIDGHVSEELAEPKVPDAGGSAFAKHGYLGVFDDAEYPVDFGGKSDLGHMEAHVARAGAFRASLAGDLVAAPYVSKSRGGTFRVRLMKIEPERLCPRLPGGVDIGDHGGVNHGAALLAAQVHVGFADRICPPSAPDVPKQLSPCSEAVQALFAEYIGAREASSDHHEQETFELLRTCFDGSDGHSQPRGRMRALSSWLTRVNARRLQQLDSDAQRAPPSPPGAASSHDSSERVCQRVYQLLCANAVRGALQVLGAAAQEAGEDVRVHFERLSTVIAAFGGASTSSLERRRSLRMQIIEWRKQGAHELMGPSLWRIYCLLAGELGDVIAGSTDWRFAFAAFLWYRCPLDCEGLVGQRDLAGVVREFAAATSGHGGLSGVGPAPLHQVDLDIKAAAAGPVRAAAGQPFAQDLQFSIISGLMGVGKVDELSRYDFRSHSPLPLAVAYSWHVSVVLLALLGSGTSGEQFQLLTQQYVFLLELLGYSDWAVYVAMFVSNARARATLVHGLLARRRSEIASPHMEKLFEGQAPFWEYSFALRHASAQEWLPAAISRLRHADTEVAVVILLGYLFGPLIGAHIDAHMHHGAKETVCLSPPMPAARWLASVLEELEPRLSLRSGAVVEVYRCAAAFMRSWTGTPAAGIESASIVPLHRKCSALRQHTLGLPW